MIPRRLDPRPAGGQYTDCKHERVIMPDEDFNEQWEDKAQALQMSRNPKFSKDEKRGR